VTGPALPALERVSAVEGRRVLVVEDDDSMREAIARLLGAAGYSFGAFVSAEELLASGAAGGAACVVSDLRLPRMSGLALLADLRARGVQVPFILITAHDRPGLRDEALRAGAEAYLAKPFAGTVLLDAVKTAIETGGLP
jgi:FixJ family two-component response regulator